MKTKFIIRFVFLALSAAVFTFSCNQENTVAPDGDAFLQTSAEKYNKLMTARETFKGTPFEIDGVEREANILKINVSGAGGIENYKIVWDGILMESYPMMTRLVVSYDLPDGVQTTVINHYTLTVDLQKLFGGSVDAADVNVQVSNGSKEDDKVIDPDGNVSSSK
ncbi:hypothetical protein DYBT9275_05996 [Dyadobacter sp. CECT 9275]|uniref:DUF4906 domain-containing protein n=1 Tax=Dyadobacter helix TaxID=2822344 RepID=A0A916JI31_9BACT|nr:hypothetical protein [Dyadobacter sp. CECT 9275]CAG5018412.1 hypothetical protein DYBT9275_05996 [Dyadobacter sp. CECT 9275]